jgi:hypothetical protein
LHYYTRIARHPLILYSEKFSRFGERYRSEISYSTLQIYYSVGHDPLEAVTQHIAIDNCGRGQFQLGMAKKPTETVTVVYDGYQESNLHEGQIYGDIFIEDSGVCIST